MVNEMWKSIIGAVLRWVLAGVSGFLLEKGILNPEQIEYLMLSLVGLVAALLWSVYQKYVAHNEKINALFTPVPESKE